MIEFVYHCRYYIERKHKFLAFSGITFCSDQLIGLSEKSNYAVRFWLSINAEIALKIETENISNKKAEREDIGM